MEFLRLHRGKGRELLLLPGWAFTSEIILELDLPFDYIYFPGPNLPHPLEGLPELLNKAGIEKVSLLGWSMGAFLASEFARRCPERVQSLILVSATSSFDKDQIEPLEEEIRKDRTRALRRFYRRCFWSRPDALKWFMSSHMEECMETWDTDSLLEGLSYLKMAHLDLRDFPPSILMVLHGEKDLITPPNRIPKLPGDVEPVIFPKACHLPFLEPGFKKMISSLAG